MHAAAALYATYKTKMMKLIIMKNQRHENKLFLCRSADDELRSVIAWGRRLLCSLGEGQKILSRYSAEKLALYVSANLRYTVCSICTFHVYHSYKTCHVMFGQHELTSIWVGSVQDSVSTFWSTELLHIYSEMPWPYSAVVLAKIICFLWQDTWTTGRQRKKCLL